MSAYRFVVRPSDSPTLDHAAPAGGWVVVCEPSPFPAGIVVAALWFADRADADSEAERLNARIR